MVSPPQSPTLSCCSSHSAGVFARKGVDAAAIAIPRYTRDIMLHRSRETYLEGIRQYAAEVTEPAPGNIALWKFGRICSHAAIITDWGDCPESESGE